jgi:hypothetical protein
MVIASLTLGLREGQDSADCCAYGNPPSNARRHIVRGGAECRANGRADGNTNANNHP